MDAKSYCLHRTSPHSSVPSPAQVTSHRGCALTAHCGAQCAADTRLHQLREHPVTPLQRISRADERRSWQCLRPFGGSVWSRLEQRLAAHRSASASDALPSDAPTSARNATCATVVAPSTTSTGRAATSLRRTCPSCAWPLQRGPHHPADPLLVPGGLLCRGVKWTRGVRRRRGPGGGVQILAPARSQIHRPCVLSPPAVHVRSPVSRSTGAPTPDAAAAPAAVCWSTPAGWFEGGKIASG